MFLWLLQVCFLPRPYLCSISVSILLLVCDYYCVWRWDLLGAFVREVEGHVQCINCCEEQINLLYDEVEELRERLGLDPRQPINIEELRHKKALHINQDRALNRVLHKEVSHWDCSCYEHRRWFFTFAVCHADVFTSDFPKHRLWFPGHQISWASEWVIEYELGKWLIEYTIFLHRLAQHSGPRKKQNLAQR